MKKFTTIELPAIKKSDSGFVRTTTNLKVGGRLLDSLTEEQLEEVEKLTAYHIALSKRLEAENGAKKALDKQEKDKWKRFTEELKMFDEIIKEGMDYIPSSLAISNVSKILASFFQPTTAVVSDGKLRKNPSLVSDDFIKVYGLYCGYARKWADTPEFTKERKESLGALTEETTKFVNEVLNGILKFKFTLPTVEQISKTFCPLAKTKKNGTAVWEPKKGGAVALQNAIFTIVFSYKEEIKW